MSTEGTGSRGQTGHSDNGQKYADSITSVNGSSSLADPNLNNIIYRHLHERSKYKCKLCGSTFKNIDQLFRHETIHEGGRFVCADVDCPCSFVSKSGSKIHVNTMHTKLHRYQCETCDRGFAGRCVYYDHLAYHTGVKRRRPTCTICGIKFMNKYSLKTHVLHLHQNETAHIL